MKKYLALSIAALALLAVSCEKNAAPETSGMIEKTFTVCAPEGTRTALSGTASVVWSAGDEINIIAKTSGNQYPFSIKEGAGSATAKFTGSIAEADKDETVFYALYPNVPVRIEETDKNNNRWALDQGQLVIDQPVTEQTAIKASFPTAAAFMTAVADADGNLAFRHGAAYFKIQIPEDDVTSIHFEVSGSARLGGRPVYSMSDGSTFQVNGAKNFMDFTCEGGFEKDAVYYLPVLTKNSTCGTLTLKFTKSSGAAASITTTKFNDVKLASGSIYDLGCPPVDFTPKVIAQDIIISSDAITVGIGEIPFTIVNPVSGYIIGSRRNAEAEWLRLHSSDYKDKATSGLIYYGVTENTGTEARTATITIKYYNASNSDDVIATTVMTITQKAPGAAAESHEHVFYYNSDGEAVNLTDGTAGNYFTATAKADLSSSYSKNFNPWTIGKYTSNKGVKMNSSGSITFTTSASLNSTVQFWFIRKNSGDTSAKMQLIPSGGTATVFDSPYDSLGDSGELSLDKGTAYTIKQSSKEQAVLLVIVKETE